MTIRKIEKTAINFIKKSPNTIICCISEEERNNILKQEKELKIKVFNYPLDINYKDCNHNNTKHKNINDISFGLLAGESYLNQQCIDFIVKNWPQNIKNNFYIAGSICKKIEKLRLPKNFKILGRINNVKDFYDLVDVFVFPIISGAGIKLKLIEAILYRKIILTTNIGMQGIKLKTNKGLKIMESDCKSFNYYLQELLYQFSENDVEGINNSLECNYKVISNLFSKKNVELAFKEVINKLDNYE